MKVKNFVKIFSFIVVILSFFGARAEPPDGCGNCVNGQYCVQRDSPTPNHCASCGELGDGSFSNSDYKDRLQDLTNTEWGESICYKTCTKPCTINDTDSCPENSSCTYQSLGTIHEGTEHYGLGDCDAPTTCELTDFTCNRGYCCMPKYVNDQWVTAPDGCQECIAAPKGWYKDNDNSKECTPCGAGKTTVSLGAKNASECTFTTATKFCDSYGCFNISALPQDTEENPKKKCPTKDNKGG